MCLLDELGCSRLIQSESVPYTSSVLHCCYTSDPFALVGHDSRRRSGIRARNGIPARYPLLRTVGKLVATVSR